VGVEGLKEALRSRLKEGCIKAVVLFGSRARGRLAFTAT